MVCSVLDYDVECFAAFVVEENVFFVGASFWLFELEIHEGEAVLVWGWFPDSEPVFLGEELGICQVVVVRVFFIEIKVC